jgi:hypothetical protein
VWKILEEGYKIPVKMTAEKKATRYREKNKKKRAGQYGVCPAGG